MKKHLLNKNGFSYVFTCIFVLVTVMVIATLLHYAYIYRTVRVHKNNFQIQLDSYVTQSAVDNYNALKQGEVYDKYINRNELVDGAYDLLESQNENDMYVLVCPEISAISDDSFGICVEYELILPFEVFGNKIADLTVPIKLVSQFKQK